MKQFCSIATYDEASAIEELRRQEYEAHPSIILINPAVLEWSSADNESLVLAAWDGSACVATMRGKVIRTLSDAEHAIESPLDCIPMAFPALLLGRAATSSDWQGRGLNSLLRFHFLRLALLQGFASLIGETNVGAPRLRLLDTLGWRSYPGISVGSILGTHGNSVIVLDLTENGTRALSVLEERTHEIAVQFPWIGEEPKLLL